MKLSKWLCVAVWCFGCDPGVVWADAAATQVVMVDIPAGEFVRGDAAGEPDEQPQKRIFVPAFRLDKTEVTVAGYEYCVKQGRCRAVLAAAASAKAMNLPVTGVSWHEAAAYCRFVGKRLPTELEWEKAARGPTGRKFPWGDTFACQYGNFGNYGGDGRCADEGAPGHPVAVGSFPAGASVYGALDLAGNVWEWVSDLYFVDSYKRSHSSAAEAEPGPQNLAGASAVASVDPKRVLRGGGCCSIFGLPRGADRLGLPSQYRDSDIGFRCASDVAAAAGK